MGREALREMVRMQVWAELRRVGRPDSRFHWDFSSFIPDYEGSDRSAQRVQQLPAWQEARAIFITPDNNLEPVRRLALENGLPFVMSTYGIERGFLALDSADVPAEDRGWAATLDGMERFARPITLAELRQRDPFDLLVTGASAISIDGIRFGKGHGYFDLEWAIFCEAGIVAPDAVVVAVGHDCQVVDIELPASPLDTRVDLIVTPTRTLPVRDGMGHQMGHVVWSELDPDTERRIPPLAELRRLTAASAE
jgi:5-formyltetrahydrofolate cyclo-ligase